MKSTWHSDKKIEKSFFDIVLLFHVLAIQKREISLAVCYKTAQEERLEIVRCDVNTRMPVSRLLGSSHFFGAL